MWLLWGGAQRAACALWCTRSRKLGCRDEGGGVTGRCPLPVTSGGRPPGAARRGGGAPVSEEVARPRRTRRRPSVSGSSNCALLARTAASRRPARTYSLRLPARALSVSPRPSISTATKSPWRARRPVGGRRCAALARRPAGPERRAAGSSCRPCGPVGLCQGCDSRVTYGPLPRAPCGPPGRPWQWRTGGRAGAGERSRSLGAAGGARAAGQAVGARLAEEEVALDGVAVRNEAVLAQQHTGHVAVDAGRRGVHQRLQLRRLRVVPGSRQGHAAGRARMAAASTRVGHGSASAGAPHAARRNSAPRSTTLSAA